MPPSDVYQGMPPSLRWSSSAVPQRLNSALYPCHPLIHGETLPWTCWQRHLLFLPCYSRRNRRLPLHRRHLRRPEETGSSLRLRRLPSSPHTSGTPTHPRRTLANGARSLTARNSTWPPRSACTRGGRPWRRTSGWSRSSGSKQARRSASTCPARPVLSHPPGRAGSLGPAPAPSQGESTRRRSALPWPHFGAGPGRWGACSGSR